MEEETITLNTDTNPCMNEETTDPKSNNCALNASKTSGIERFKGVVPQQNGHWGAQIYGHNKRIWLGTFKSEIDAAMAYDSAAIKLSSGDSHRNISWNSVSVHEPKFQSHFTTNEVLNMIRDGSYPSKFAEFLRYQSGEIDRGLDQSYLHGYKNGTDSFSCTLLFQKELTPSDVGKLNRLVIPKRYAVMHFPNVPDTNEAMTTLDLRRSEHEVQLEFYDKQMILWKFRYCYWKSSQSFVFTRGWNRFVKEKSLREFDTIAFYKYERRGEGPLRQSFMVIDVIKRHPSIIKLYDEGLRLDNLGDNRSDSNEGKDEVKTKNRENGSPEGFSGSAQRNNDSKGFRLFGVQIE